jgi:hypothetical protein
LNQINEIIVPIAIAVDFTKVAVAMKKDYDNNSSRNTAETCTKIACGWTGGALGKFFIFISSLKYVEDFFLL